jgi:hypothetical protein
MVTLAGLYLAGMFWRNIQEKPSHDEQKSFPHKLSKWSLER